MANLKVNSKTEFLYLEENFFVKLVEILNKYIGQKILFITDNKSQILIRQNLTKLKCEVLFYLKEKANILSENGINDIMSQCVDKNNLKYHLQTTTLIVAIGDDDEINIAKQISAQFNMPYIAVLNQINSAISYSSFYMQNFEIKKGYSPLGIIVDLNESTADCWKQKIVLENAKINTIKATVFFDEIFLGKQNFYFNTLYENILKTNKNLFGENIKIVAEKFCDFMLLQQNENIYFSLFLLTQTYKTISQKNSLNNEFILYKTLIKIYEVFTNSFLIKYKCFKCYDLVLNNINKELINSSYIKYVLTNFYELINSNLTEFYSEMQLLENDLNNISFVKMYNDKMSMSSNEILKSLKLFARLQKSPTFLNIIDFYNLF